MMKDGNPRDAMLLAHVLSAIISIPFIILYPPLLSASSVISIIYMGFLQVGLASLLFAYALKRISAVKAMITAVLEPVLNPVWVLLFTGEKPSMTALAGGAIIITAIVGSSLISMKRQERKKLYLKAAND